MSVLRTPPIDLTWIERLGQAQDIAGQDQQAPAPLPAGGLKVAQATAGTASGGAEWIQSAPVANSTANLTDSAFAPRVGTVSMTPDLGRPAALASRIASLDGPSAGQISQAAADTSWHDVLVAELTLASDSLADLPPADEAGDAGPWPSVVTVQQNVQWSRQPVPMELPEPVGFGVEVAAAVGPAAVGADGSRPWIAQSAIPPDPVAAFQFGDPRPTAPPAAAALPPIASGRAAPLKVRRALAVAAGVLASGLAVASLAGLGDLFTALEAATASANLPPPSQGARVVVLSLAAQAEVPTATGALKPVAHVVETQVPVIAAGLAPPTLVAMAPETAAPAVPSVIHAARAVRMASLDPQMPAQVRTAAAEPSPAFARERPPVAARPKVVLDMSVPAEEAVRVPFPIRVDGGDPSAVSGRLVVRGLPEHATLSRGRFAGAGTWQVPLQNLQDLSLTVPPLTPGEFELLIELRSAAGELLSSGLSVVRVVPRPRIVAATPTVRRAVLGASAGSGTYTDAAPVSASTAPAEPPAAGPPVIAPPIVTGAVTDPLPAEPQASAAGLAPPPGVPSTGIGPDLKRRPMATRRLLANDPYRSGLGGVDRGASQSFSSGRRGPGDSGSAGIFDQRKGI